MTTPAEQEAGRRYPVLYSDSPAVAADLRGREHAFIDGAEWAESRHRELLEAAREYRDAKKKHRKGWIAYAEVDRVATRILAAAAALDEEGGE